MNAGILCLVGDSVEYQLSKLNQRVLRLQHYLDFDEPLPDLQPFEDELYTITANYERLIAATNHPFAATALDSLVSSATRNELEYMLRRYLKEDDDDFECPALTLSLHMLKNAPKMRRKYFRNYLRMYDDDHVKTFVHMVDMFVPPADPEYKRIVTTLRQRRLLCDRIASRLVAFKT
ncbi:orf129-like protein [Peridroma alphabaculovirus]|uniref:Orf129-like protein n=1 Tax=Peridroma alphabaculovirus TaxID=1346829 RepID=A0A068LKL7_9ABAC|nr:orf129-like protein [Peridroma alphabaculovirus]AIE47844.1 orf129-like protein [Peridroma alphabaculovirus]